MPPIPPWEEIHPLIVHFPIALLCVAPVFVLLTVLTSMSQTRSQTFAFAALVVMALGTIGAFVAVNSGEAAEEAAERQIEGNADADHELHEHEEGAELAAKLFAGLTVLYAAVVFVPLVLKKKKAKKDDQGKKYKPTVNIVANLVFLLLYAGGLYVLVNAAHDGAELVHHHGVQASPTGDRATPAGTDTHDDDD